jgi:carbamoyl-phosphate synthase large subunit
MKQLNILFIGGGKRYSAAECFIEAGKKLNLNIQIFAYEMGYGLPIEKIATVFQGLKFADPEIFNDLKNVIKNNKIAIAIPYHDHAVDLLAQLKDVVFTPASDAKVCQTFFSKIASNQYFESIGLPTAGFNGKVPAIAKPDRGSASKGLIFFREQVDLDSFLQTAESSKYEIQQLIDGQEYSVDGYIAMNSDFHFFAPRKRLETLGGEAVRSITINHSAIEEACKKLASQNGIQGAITIQFIEDKVTKNVYTMEVNPRFGGAMLTTWGAGVPWFEIVLCDYLNLPIPTFNFSPNVLMVRSFREHFFEGYIHE